MRRWYLSCFPCLRTFDGAIWADFRRDSVNFFFDRCGAVIPPAMGAMTDAIGNQTGSVIVIGICLVYLICCAFKLRTR